MAERATFRDYPIAAPAPEVLRRAHRLLLDRPVLVRTQRPEEYRLVARQIDPLARWHHEHTGWPIYYDERGGVIRLRRRPSLASSGIWEPWKSDVNLSSPRDYACLVYLLWYARSPLALSRGGPRQVLLSDLCERLAHRSALGADGEGKDYEPLDFAKRRSDYWSLRRALKALEDLGAVVILDEVSAVNSGDNREIGQALVEFTDVVEALIVELNLDAVTAARAGRPDPLSLSAPVLDDASPPLRRAWRTLLLGPVLLRRDDPAAFEAVDRQHNLIETDGEELFGYTLDLAPTYARFIRPSGTSFDRTPTVLNHQQRGVVHAGLLLCAAIRERVSDGRLHQPDADGCLELATSALKQIFRAVCAEHQRRWGNELADANPDTVLVKAGDALRVAGLIRGPDARGKVLILPTAARYRATYDVTESEAAPAATIGANGVQLGFGP